jgi:hypothetical protein
METTLLSSSGSASLHQLIIMEFIEREADQKAIAYSCKFLPNRATDLPISKRMKAGRAEQFIRGFVSYRPRPGCLL